MFLFNSSVLGVMLGKMLRRWLLISPARSIPTMPLFSMVDLPQIAVITHRQWLTSVQCLRLYQRHLNVQHWSGIHTIYPRSFIWAYLYFLFGWGRYCHVLEHLLNQPDKSIIAEVFIRYICEMDDYLDSFDSRALLQADYRSARQMPTVRAISAELSLLLTRFAVSPADRYAILRLIATYRRAYFEALRRASMQRTLPQVIADKERVAGDLWYVWACILGHVYRLPVADNQCGAQLLFNLGMFIQVLDDIADTPMDYRNHTQNLFLAIAQQSTEEWQRLSTYLEKNTEPFISWAWVKRETPEAYVCTMKLFDAYGARLLEDQHNPAVTHDLYSIVRRMLALAY